MRQLQVASLADVCLLVTDGTHDTPKRVDEGFPLIKAKEIVGGAIDFDSCDQISETEHLRVIARSKPEYGDTLFAHIGASLGEAALVKTHRPFSIKNIALFKPNPDVIDGCYLYYLVISPEFQDLAKNTKTGSAQPFLSLGHLRSHRIHFHERLEDQRRIAYILSAYDDLIENNLRRIKILEEIAQNLYREWFVKFRFPGHANVRMVDSPLGKIPEGWEVVTLGELVNIPKGKNITKKTIVPGDVPVVAGGIAPAYYHNAANTRNPVITISASGANAGFVNLYYHDVWASDCSVIDLSATKHVYYFYLLLKDRQYEVTRLQRGAAQPHVYPKDLMALDALSVPEEILEFFARNIGPIFKMIKNMKEKNKNLHQTRDLLLPKLISGELDISELEIDTGKEAA